MNLQATELPGVRAALPSRDLAKGNLVPLLIHNPIMPGQFDVAPFPLAFEIVNEIHRPRSADRLGIHEQERRAQISRAVAAVFAEQLDHAAPADRIRREQSFLHLLLVRSVNGIHAAPADVVVRMRLQELFPCGGECAGSGKRTPDPCSECRRRFGLVEQCPLRRRVAAFEIDPGGNRPAQHAGRSAAMEFAFINRQLVRRLFFEGTVDGVNPGEPVGVSSAGFGAAHHLRQEALRDLMIHPSHKPERRALRVVLFGGSRLEGFCGLVEVLRRHSRLGVTPEAAGVRVAVAQAEHSHLRPIGGTPTEHPRRGRDRKCAVPEHVHRDKIRNLPGMTAHESEGLDAEARADRRNVRRDAEGVRHVDDPHEPPELPRPGHSDQQVADQRLGPGAIDIGKAIHRPGVQPPLGRKGPQDGAAFGTNFKVVLNH